MKKSDWQEVNNWEAQWWGKCLNTFLEEEKQLRFYAPRMGLHEFKDNAIPHSFDVKGKKILDVGGGPVSLLLKCKNRDPHCAVIDPLPVPGWVKYRYVQADIDFYNIPAEEMGFSESQFDEAWIYNCLQHTMNPEEIVRRAVKASKQVRIFEWIDTPPHTGHPQTLRSDKLDEWLSGEGRVEEIEKTGMNRAYYGVFPKNI